MNKGIFVFFAIAVLSCVSAIRLENIKPKNGGIHICEVCAMVVQETEKLIDKHYTYDEIMKHLEEFCKYIPSILQQACQDFLSDFASDIVKSLLNGDDPAKICAEYELCSYDPARLGGNVVVGTCNSSDTRQQWIINSDDTVQSAMAGLHYYALDVWQDSKANGANVQVWEKKSTDNQKWDFSSTTGNFVVQSVKRCLSVSVSYGDEYENVQVNDCIPSSATSILGVQKWTSKLDSNGYSLFMNEATGKCLTVLPQPEWPGAMTRPIIVGHRGTTWDAPENTLPAFQAAIDVGADGFETDLWLTKDNVLVLCHDPTVDRTSNCSGKISDFMYDDILKCDFGSYFDPKFTGTKIPRFDEAVTLAHENKVFIVMDLKELDTPEAEQKRLEIIAQDLSKYEAMQANALASCRDIDQCRKYHAVINGTAVQRLENQPKTWDDSFFVHENADSVEGYSLSQSSLTPEFIRAAHRHLLAVFSWTPDSETQVVDALKLGVDGCVTGDPRLMRDVILSVKERNPIF